ncbi:FecR family protein [Yeosuana marina]|uniref:FecR family protein n=1 Tax=Yeosuana marina TaxID=1565536 RepID=UPI0030EF9096|tara:strand:- start:6607 stop:7746 length:1140 start_codon:yes stop_codon:yes gene_type:complete
MKSLILKYFTDSLNETEKEQLLNLLEKPENLKEFKAYAKENYHLNIVYDDINEEAALLKVKSVIQNQEKPVRKFYWRYAAVAASIVLLISIAFIFNKNDGQVVEPVIVNNNIKVGTDKASLTLGDGSVIVLEKGKEYITDNIESTGEDLVYSKPKETKVEVAYNYLTIPRGGQYHVILSDGTEVWLNSESQLKYPVSFTDGESRQVELVYGEAYFEVSHSIEHKGSDFNVHHQGQDIQVLGTKFNVKAYKGENNIYTTLVQGKVAVGYQDIKKILLPNDQSVLNTRTGLLKVDHLSSVYNEIAWKDGVFSFDDMPLKEIAKALERWYNMEVIFKNKELEKLVFIGKIKKSQSIVEILNAIKNASIINSYQIKNKMITLE